MHRELLKALAEAKHIVVNFVILELLTFSFTQVNQLQHSFTCYISPATPKKDIDQANVLPCG